MELESQGGTVVRVWCQHQATLLRGRGLSLSSVIDLAALVNLSKVKKARFIFPRLLLQTTA